MRKTTCIACGNIKDNTIKKEEWMTTKEASGYLRLSTGALLNMVWVGDIKAYKLGRRNRYLKSDLENLFR
jgi:excisionase family DNA binding protein